MSDSPPASPDRIEKQVTLRAPIARVWHALTDYTAFSAWFGVKLTGPFVVGQAVHAIYDVPADVEALTQTVAAFQQQQGLPPSPVRFPRGEAVFGVVERMDAPRLFSFRWIPFGIDATVADLATEPTTLVEFHLEEQGAHTRLTIVESGFSRVPAHRRARAFLMNSAGWQQQAANLARHVETI